MRYIFKFPDIGEGISEGVIIKWYVEPGRHVKSGDNLVQMETDKVVADIPSPREGDVVAVFGRPGDTIRVEDALVELDIEGVHGEKAQEMASEKPVKPPATPVKEESFGIVGVLEEAGDQAYLPAGDEGRPASLEPGPRKKAMATPVARALAKNLGIDINLVPGTGPRGRVTRQDIQDYHDGRVSPPTGKTAGDSVAGEPLVEYIPLTQIRKTIAGHMSRSIKETAHMSVHDLAEVSRLVEIRKKYRDRLGKPGLKLTYLPFVAMATARALREHLILNSRLDLKENRIVRNLKINMGIAMDAPGGLVVPVIKDADTLSVGQLAEKIQDLSKLASERKLTLEQMEGGTFSITNYGAIGGRFGVPIINYPQSAILGVGRISREPVVRDEQVVPGWILPLSLSVDHRIVDGGEVTRFLNRVMEYLSDPVGMLLL